MGSTRHATEMESLIGGISSLASRASRLLASSFGAHSTDEINATLAQILQLMSQLRGSRVVRLEQKLSGELYEGLNLPRGDSWEGFEQYKAMPARFPMLAYLWIFHCNGWLREAALEAMDGPFPCALLFCAVKWRMNDWAGPVREAAQRAFTRCAPQTPDEVVARGEIDLIEQSIHWERWGRERSLKQADLIRPSVALQIAHQLAAAKSGPQARLLSLFLQRWTYLDSLLPGLAREAAQPQLRAKAYFTLFGGKARWRNHRAVINERPLTMNFDLPALREACAADPSPAVRKLAVADAIQRRDYGPASQELAKKLVNDPSPAVRERAAFILGKNAG